MENCTPLRSETDSKHRPLTLFRLVRGLICLVVFLSTAFMFLAYLAPGAVFLRLLSIGFSRKAASFFFGIWLGLWPFLFEKINRTKVVFSGDVVPSKERVMVIANHRTEVDWMYLWDLALRKGCLGHIKYVLKSSLMKLPVFGWGFHVLEFFPLERKWEVDEPILRQMLSNFSDPRDPLWLAIFPEGTDFTYCPVIFSLPSGILNVHAFYFSYNKGVLADEEINAVSVCEQKSKNCQKFAAEVGFPVLSNVLLPKTKGFCACLEVLRDSLDAVYDLTIAYKNNCPSFLDNVFGLDPLEVHIHVRRIPVKNIPSSEGKASSWLIDAFQLKDKLLSNFKAEGHFPNRGTEEELSSLKCFANFGLVILLTAIFTYLTFCSSVWFKMYISFSCVYLALATHLNIQPTPFLGSIRAMFCFKKTRND